ncbi:MAG: hypothetical protein M5U19_04775 [Microthrixaceae bacterium]|nr:hypothetical protein [Microthrixaceae bacterium]
MRVPLSWLQEFTPVDLPPAELAEVLAELGFEVDAIESVGSPLMGVVAARVLATEPHPDADRIQLVQVDRGTGSRCRSAVARST